MKKLFAYTFSSVLMIIVLAYSATAQKLDGAWKLLTTGTIESTCIIADNYFMQTTYDKINKVFIGTMGGTFKAGNEGSFEVTIEFNKPDSSLVGQTHTIHYQLKDGQLIISIHGKDDTWQRIDDGTGPLAGNWRITDREQDGKMMPMRPGPRKTLKILSDTRFQWAAINPETKEFFGTGGGTYTFNNGKYTESIEFFSRDNSRVGAALSFEGKVDGKSWHHSGKSSKGDPIAEIWKRQ